MSGRRGNIFGVRSFREEGRMEIDFGKKVGWKREKGKIKYFLIVGD